MKLLISLISSTYVYFRVRKNKPTGLQSEVSVNMNILRRQKPETTTQADQADMDYSQIDDGNGKRKQQKKSQMQQEEEIDNSKQHNRKTDNTNL